MSRRFARLLGSALFIALSFASARAAFAQAIALPRPTQSPAAIVAAAVPDGATVALLVTVTRDGTVEDAKLVEEGDSALDAAALEVVSHWTFTPATRDGQPIPARIRVLVPLISRPKPEPAATSAPPVP
ncbi:MAG TPA: energy transducer TonB, partial [Polyangiaceae bacterium]|nr:energy transducer TonB [Polyangiaceae bacterium]